MGKSGLCSWPDPNWLRHDTYGVRFMAVQVQEGQNLCMCSYLSLPASWSWMDYWIISIHIPSSVNLTILKFSQMQLLVINVLYPCFPLLLALDSWNWLIYYRNLKFFLRFLGKLWLVREEKHFSDFNATKHIILKNEFEKTRHWAPIQMCQFIYQSYIQTCQPHGLCCEVSWSHTSTLKRIVFLQIGP